MSRGIGKLQFAILEHLRKVEQDTTRGILHALYPSSKEYDEYMAKMPWYDNDASIMIAANERARRRGKPLPYVLPEPPNSMKYWDYQRSAVNRALHSLVKRGLVVKHGYVAETVRYAHKARAAVWAVVSSSK